MAKRYIATKIGDRYELLPKSPEEIATWAGFAVGGGALAVIGLSRRSLGGLVLAIAGGAMMYRGLTGKNPLELMSRFCCGRSEGDTPSYHHDFVGRATQVPEDDVEEASMESFPASDAPSSTRTEPAV